MIAILWVVACVERTGVPKNGGCSNPAGALGNSRSGREEGHVRTVPMPDWVKGAVDRWTTAAHGPMGESSEQSADMDRLGAGGFQRMWFGTWLGAVPGV